MGMVDSQRLAPYVTYSSRPSVYENTEAVPSTQSPHQIPYHARPTRRPTSETKTSGTTANAEPNQPVTEKEEAPPQTRRPRGEGVPRPHRERYRMDVHELRAWAKALQGSNELPSHKDAIAGEYLAETIYLV